MLKPKSFLLFSALLLLLMNCKPSAAEVQIPIKVQFVEGAAAARLISADPIEGYFEHWSPTDARLQMGLADSVDISRAEYQQWLSGLPQVWPSELKNKLGSIWNQVLSECFSRYPNLELADIPLILTLDKPYGSFVYFTRQNAVICPISDLREASRGELLEVMRHELFHLISRTYLDYREAAYAVIGFVPAPDSLVWPGDLYARRLHNPDAPFPNYALSAQEQLFVPIVYAAQSPYDPDNPDHFAEQLRFNYFKLKGDSLVRPILPAQQVMSLTGGLTDYLLHPEEILADQFVLLLEQGGPGEDPYLRQLDQTLKGD